jgi:non-heme chloroperoxidase
MPQFNLRDDTSLYFEDHGAGRPLVFIHGWPLSGAMWEYQIVPLTRAGFRCVTFDRRGFGRSGKPYSGFDYDSLGQDLAELIEHLDLKDVTLIGFSMGGGEVMEYLTKRNQKGRVTKAILVSSIVPYLLNQIPILLASTPRFLKRCARA